MIAANVVLFAWQWHSSPMKTVVSTASAPVVMRTPGGVLEVSTVSLEERFDGTRAHGVLGVPLGKTVAQIRVPAVYRFHIPLAPEWTLRPLGDALLVIAPKIRPSLPVAIDTGKLESLASGLWSPLTGAETLKTLQASITESLNQKATRAEMIQSQREAARKTVTEFVGKWVVEQDRWRGAKAPTILVFFEDEPVTASVRPLFEVAR